MAVIAGVFDGHGIQGRRAALAASEAIMKHLQADPRSEHHSIPREWERVFADACVQVRTCHSTPCQRRPCDAVSPDHPDSDD